MKVQNLARKLLMSSYSDDPEFHTAPPRLKLRDEGYNLPSGLWRWYWPILAREGAFRFSFVVPLRLLAEPSLAVPPF